MTVVDDAVLVAYLLFMLSVGFYYSRRARTNEDYLLGGRGMSPVMVGLSLFATLASTLTYLALPGEAIKHGPMIFAQFVALPFSWLVVGWLLIPRIMSQNVTTGYELLESRLGLTGRLLGAGVFVVLRVIWMAAILYATTDKVIVPIFELDSSWTPVLCTVLGAMTLIYTVQGGFKAVVLTDALQAMLMLAGAFATILMVTIALGGVEPWWPTTWPEHWQQPVFWPDPAVRLTFVGAGINMFVWMTCTAGSDQMAVQRYLATRDAPAARRLFAVNLWANVLLSCLLGLAGVAVFGYFLHHPEMLTPGKALLTDADQLFPRFIVVGLPAGLTGLVVAALLSAAMSSLSSGLNSSSAVIVTDLLGRLFDVHRSQGREVRLARLSAAFVGIIAVGLSTVIGYLPGNLLELCFKLVNLLTAPLFILFFLALFVPWATPLGAILGVATAIVVAVEVAYVQDLLLWMAPASLLAGMLAGILGSLIPVPGRTSIGPRHESA